jgi:restriction system protein
MYVIEMEHRGLNKHRLIRGGDRVVVQRKADLQEAAWDQQWAARMARQAALVDKADKAAEAVARTAEAQLTIEGLRSILSHTLGVDDVIDWRALRRSHECALPPPPEPSADSFLPRIGFLDRLLTSRRRRKIEASEAEREEAMRRWRRDVAKWQADIRRLRQEVEEHNAAIDAQKLRYVSGDAEAVAEYCDLVLSRSSYPDTFPQEFQTDYEDSTRTLVVEYRLPAPSDLPTLKEVRYVTTRDEFREEHLKDQEIKSLYDGVVYQVALRTIHEVLEADEIDAIDAVVFNGWVHYVDPRTGDDTKACIASVQATKHEFSRINLAAVDPKECFRSLKGVAAAKLACIAPVAPILQLNKED